METVACAICGGTQTDLLFPKWGFTVVQCSNCGLAFVNPRTFGAELDEYFRGPYLSTIEENGVLNPGIGYLYNNILDHLNAYLRPGRLLDIGCAMGHFMVQARQQGWNCQGVECSPYAAEYGRKRWELRIRPVCDLREARLPDNHFDACVLVEVAEHLPHPRMTFTEAFKLLKPGGMLYITTPNFASYQALLGRENWTAVIPTGHLYYFTADSLGRLLRAIGFDRIVNLTPPGSLDGVIEILRSSGQDLPEPLVDSVRQKCATEDQGRLTNTRGEGLVMCAIKPHTQYSAIQASMRFTKPVPSLEGKLVTSPGPGPEDHKVYLISEGRKHWVTSVDWLTKHGMSLDQTMQVESELLQSILTGAPLE